MTFPNQLPVSIPEIGESLANFSLDRESVQFALNRLPDEPSINKVAIEYEIQLLKILSVGWAISYFMEDHSEKTPLIKKFWDVLFEFSKNLSSVTSLTIGKEVDYFRALKERIDIYLNALAEVPHVKDPASVIGPTFARLCGNTDNVHVIMAGNRVFHLSLEGVKHFLESVFSAATDLSVQQSDYPDRRFGTVEC
jgi:hypothetical protein